MHLSNFFVHDKQVTGVKGLVYVGSKILVYRRDNQTALFPGYIDLPGGGSEGNETPFETFAREVNEEFSLAIKRSHIVYAEKRPTKSDPLKAVFFAVAKLPASYTKNIILGDEGSEWLLMDVTDFLNRNDVWPYFQSRVKEYLSQDLKSWL